MSYANDTIKSQSDWDVAPTGRFCTKKEAIVEFITVREKLIEFISQSDTDFRQVFTYRKIPQELIEKNPMFYGIREVRDLHQLVLNCIAHTYRHFHQLLRIRRRIEQEGNT